MDRNISRSDGVSFRTQFRCSNVKKSPAMFLKDKDLGHINSVFVVLDELLEDHQRNLFLYRLVHSAICCIHPANILRYGHSRYEAENLYDNRILKSVHLLLHITACEL